MYPACTLPPFNSCRRSTDSDTRLDVEKMLQELAQPGEGAMDRSQLRKRVQDLVDQVNALKQDLNKVRPTIPVLVSTL